VQRKTQCERLLELLRSHKFKRVPLPAIQALGIAQHGTRLKELRALGYVIRNEMEHSSDGTQSWYVLLAEPGEPVPLFGGLPPERYPD
jgi:hypothetical protein